ncbi:Hypothetical protein HVR_LOCUS925 [uncultured virus]|nr:Hypothetical protein HVR_LOCUS925 [uncultured virus]
MSVACGSNQRLYYFCGVRIARDQFIKALFGKDMPLLAIRTKMTCDPDTFRQYHPSRNPDDRKILSLALDLFPVGEDIITGICLRFSDTCNLVFELGGIDDPADLILNNYLKSIDSSVPAEVRKLIKVSDAQYHILVGQSRGMCQITSVATARTTSTNSQSSNQQPGNSQPENLQSNQQSSGNQRSSRTTS